MMERMKLTARIWRPRRKTQAGRDVPPRRNTHRTPEQSPQRLGIDAQMPSSMPRAEDDAITRGGSRDFHDLPGSGADTARRKLFF